MLVLGFATSLVISACGGASSGAGSTSSTGSPGAAASPSPAGAADGQMVTDYPSYLGGKAGAADPAKSPIGIGWVNVEGGSIGSTPEATRAAQSAVRYVNDKLGGIGGHPLTLKVCTISSAEEEGQKCGQQMLNDAGVQGVAFGNVFMGDTSFNAVVDGQKPLIVGVADGPSSATAKNAFILFGDLTHVFAPWGTYARDVLHARTAAVIYTNQPGDKAAGAAVRKGLEAAGLTVTAVGFDPQATDLLGPVTAAGVQTADVVVPIGTGQGCVGIAKALKQLGVSKPIVATPVCLAGDVAAGLGGDLPSWTYGIAQTLPTDTSAADAKAYLDASSGEGLAGKDATQVFAALAWSEILTYAKMFNQVGADKVSPATVTAALKQFTGPVIMGAPQVTCGRYPDAPGVCNDRSKFYTYQGKGVFAPVAGWLQPPA